MQLVLASATADTPPVRRVAAQLLTSPLMLRLRPPIRESQPADVLGDLDGGLGGGGDDEAFADAAALSALGAQLPSCITHGLLVISPNKGLKAVHALHHTTPSPRCLVFVNSPYRARFVCKRLLEEYNIPAVSLYGEQEREERVATMRKLVDGSVRIAVSTEMGARGLDLPGLSHVVNLELPTDPSHYVHRAGRCGRAGAAGTVISLAPPGKAFVVEKLTRALGVPLQNVHIKGGRVEAGRAKGGGQGAPTKVRRQRAVSRAAVADNTEAGPPTTRVGGGGGRRSAEGAVAGTKKRKKSKAKDIATKAPKAKKPPKVKRGYPRPKEETAARRAMGDAP